jgi:hypothetical protein
LHHVGARGQVLQAAASTHGFGEHRRGGRPVAGVRRSSCWPLPSRISAPTILVLVAEIDLVGHGVARPS